MSYPSQTSNSRYLVQLVQLVAQRSLHLVLFRGRVLQGTKSIKRANIISNQVWLIATPNSTFIWLLQAIWVTLLCWKGPIRNFVKKFVEFWLLCKHYLAGEPESWKRSVWNVSRTNKALLSFKRCKIFWDSNHHHTVSVINYFALLWQIVLMPLIPERSGQSTVDHHKGCYFSAVPFLQYKYIADTDLNQTNILLIVEHSFFSTNYPFLFFKIFESAAKLYLSLSVCTILSSICTLFQSGPPHRITFQGRPNHLIALNKNLTCTTYFTSYFWSSLMKYVL